MIHQAREFFQPLADQQQPHYTRINLLEYTFMLLIVGVVSSYIKRGQPSKSSF